MIRISICFALFYCFCFSGMISAQQVKIIRKQSQWHLLVNNKPFYIKGVVGDSYLEKVKTYGGNTVRLGWEKQNLDNVSRLKLYAMVNLPAEAERDGMDYNDTGRVRKQTGNMVAIVRKMKSHPAVLMWAIGNELDFIPPTLPYNLKMWDAVNQTAKAIKAIDPNHPVMTVIGTSMMSKVSEIVKRCPDLDLLGINAYGDIYTLADTLKKYGWKKPYVISEWGPDGYWEVKKTPWGAPYEQTGREKFNCYKNKYQQAIASKSGDCLGSFVFYWSGNKQETTHTWFCIFNAEGMETPLPGLMKNLWTSQINLNEAPLLDSLQIDNYSHFQAVYLGTGSSYTAKSWATDADHDSLSYKWEIRPEATYASYAGQGEKEPLPLEGLIYSHQSEIKFTAPANPGAYRLFVFVFDGHGHFSSANLPFYVKKDFQGKYPLPTLPDTSNYGRYTSRTMHLLHSSTPQKRNTVKILVYGQSISAQNWWLEVKKMIEKKFPSANLIIENKSIGGFASQILCKTVEMDVSSFYPDLVLLHIYGSNQMYDSVLHTIRSRTAAEVAIQTDHYTGYNHWSDTMSYYLLPAMAEKYKCDLINIRDPWKKYLADNQLDSSQLLTDGTHLNEFGNFLMAELIKPLFTYKSKFPDDPFGLLKTYHTGTDVKYHGNTLQLTFSGNKAEVILDNDKIRENVSAEIRLDGHKPSEFQGTYYVSRPYNQSGKAWPWELPAWVQIRHITPWENEEWTCRFSEVKPPYNDFRFEISGSKTGPDGTGKASEDFKSASGKIMIHKSDAEDDGDWHLRRSFDVLKTQVMEGDDVHWKTYSISTDILIPHKTAQPSMENSTILFQGVPNSRHLLTIHCQRKMPIREIKIYQPYIHQN